jgi:hypothetical protein
MTGARKATGRTRRAPAGLSARGDAEDATSAGPYPDFAVDWNRTSGT